MTHKKTKERTRTRHPLRQTSYGSNWKEEMEARANKRKMGLKEYQVTSARVLRPRALKTPAIRSGSSLPGAIGNVSAACSGRHQDQRTGGWTGTRAACAASGRSSCAAASHRVMPWIGQAGTREHGFSPPDCLKRHTCSTVRVQHTHRPSHKPRTTNNSYRENSGRFIILAPGVLYTWIASRQASVASKLLRIQVTQPFARGDRAPRDQ